MRPPFSCFAELEYYYNVRKKALGTIRMTMRWNNDGLNGIYLIEL
jgi:hypothetical protein